MKRLTNFRLPTTDGGSFSLEDIRQRPATLLVFYKAACETSVYTLKLLNDFRKRHPHSPAPIYLISQDSPEETDTFLHHHGMVLPVAVDYPEYRLSCQFAFHSVPALFLVNGEGKVLGHSEGFVKGEVENLISLLFTENGLSAPPVFAEREDVVPLRPG